MPEVAVDLPPTLFARLQQIAAERSCPVADVVRHFLTVAVGMYGSALMPDEITARVDSFGPKLPRPVIDRARLRAVADRYKPAPPGEPTG